MNERSCSGAAGYEHDVGGRSVGEGVFSDELNVLT